MQLSFARSAGARAERLRKLHAILDRLEMDPLMETAGVVDNLPLSEGMALFLRVKIDGMSLPDEGNEDSSVRDIVASDGYFRTFGIRLLAGRTLASTDDSLSPSVVVINETMARRFWSGVSPLGHMVNAMEPATVVGVVADAREIALKKAPAPQMYSSIDKRAPTGVTIVARSALPPGALLRHLEDAVHAVDRTQAVYNVRMMDDVVAESVVQPHTNALLISGFAAVAFLLAIFGVYAMVAYSVAQRWRELGIRAALGATRYALMRSVVSEIGPATMLGGVAGMVAAWALTRSIASMLYEVPVHDWIAFSLAPSALLLATALATLVPAIRAARVDPVQVMRAD